ncbi:MAG: haloalkane dehalogenase [Woeseiaceae bacterium]|jgi:haloalkane dehalogenase|tara:strand:- start:596 stop:1471 length:876 start_codon:yes stop_codon:yes gene_type:complete
MMINTKPRKKFITVNNKKMAYIEMGHGDPIVFQHGNPTSSYLWRNIMPHLSKQGRCIAIDLIGMGDSEKLDQSGPNKYLYEEQREYLFKAWEQLEVNKNVTLVIHDWGSALGFDWAFLNPSAVRGIVYMEALVRPVKWSEWPDSATNIFKAFRSNAGEELILNKNFFVEGVLPNSIIRELNPEEMAIYREPFLRPGEDRRPTLSWPREIPIDGSPGNVNKIVSRYAKWLEKSDIPKLFINAEPGSILVGKQREYCRTWKNQTEVTVPGKHFLQEDSANEIGENISKWLRKL